MDEDIIDALKIGSVILTPIAFIILLVIKHGALKALVAISLVTIVFLGLALLIGIIAKKIGFYW